jgi:hypothetical protein
MDDLKMLRNMGFSDEECQAILKASADLTAIGIPTDPLVMVSLLCPAWAIDRCSEISCEET